MFCKYCGKELSDDSTFCQYCGKAQPAAQGNTQNGAQRTVQDPAPATAQPVRRAGPRKSFFKRLKAGTRLFSFTAGSLWSLLSLCWSAQRSFCWMLYWDSIL